MILAVPPSIAPDTDGLIVAAVAVYHARLLLLARRTSPADALAVCRDVAGGVPGAAREIDDATADRDDPAGAALVALAVIGDSIEDMLAAV